MHHLTLLDTYVAYDETFQSFILEYSVQWERDVVGSVTRALEQSDTLRREVDHYQAKVQSLQNERPSLFSKSKEPDPKDVEKLNRNKAKLADARVLYEDHVQELCAIIEEVTDRGWKNMVPILIKLGQSDQTVALNEHELMSHLDSVVAAIKKIGSGSVGESEDVDTVTDAVEPSAPPPAVPSCPPPLAPPTLPSSVEESSEEDPVIEKVTEDLVEVQVDDASEVPKAVESNEEVSTSESPQTDVGTSFSPRSYMY